MNYKTLTTLLAFALCLLACNEQKRFTTLPEKNWERFNLHGKVKKLETVLISCHTDMRVLQLFPQLFPLIQMGILSK